MDDHIKRKLEEDLLEPDDFYNKHGLWFPERDTEIVDLDKLMEKINGKIQDMLKSKMPKK